MKLHTYVMAPGPVSTRISYIRTASLYVYPLTLARKRLNNYVPAATNIQVRTEDLLACSFLYGPYSIKIQSVGLCISLALLGNGSVNTFSRKRGIIGGSVFLRGPWPIKRKVGA
jgi:hypothetical protein